MSGQLWVPRVEDPHIKAKGLGKEGKLAQWNVTESKGNAPGFCLGEEATGTRQQTAVYPGRRQGALALPEEGGGTSVQKASAC